MMVIIVFVPIARAVPPDLTFPQNNVKVEKENSSALLSSLRIELHDASVEEAFELIGEALGDGINVVVNPSAKAIRIPSFTLKNANVLIVSDLISNLVADLEIWVNMKGEFCPLAECLYEYYKMMNQKERSEDTSEAAPVFSLPVDFTPVLLVKLATDDHRGHINRDFRIYPIELILNEYGWDIANVQDIATAIETAWDMIPESYSANIKYHKETTLLICAGTPEHLEVVDQVMEALGGEWEIYPQRKKIQKLQSEVNTMQKELDALKKLNESLQVVIESLRKEVADFQQAAKGASNADTK
jgi:hypothetical protein